MFENKDLLKGFKILDLSYRLPGPLAGKILKDLGAEVIKIEDHKFGDPFNQGLFAEFDPSFKNWYKNLNEGKQIETLDFSSSDDQNKLKELVSNCDGLIMGLPSKIEKKLKLDPASLSEAGNKLAYIRMGSKKGLTKGMHDLNAMAECGLLDLYAHNNEYATDFINPPFLPFAGISYGHKLATDLLAAILKCQKTNSLVELTTYLYNTTEDVLSPFWPKEDREDSRHSFLHNGKYPCYGIYKTKDSRFVALAAVEEKFWARFCDIFKCKLSMEDRFEFKSPHIKDQVTKTFLSYNWDEIKELTKDADLCLSLI